MPSPIEVLFLDVDDTLYPPESGLWSAIGQRINRYMVERVGIPAERVSQLRMQYFQQYGTTLNGLRALHDIDPRDYLEFVHDLPITEFLHRDEILRARLRECPQPKWAFSNADRAHIERVLAALGIRDVITGIIDIYATEFDCKPYPAAYPKALRLAGVANPKQCLMVDDQVRNLEPALELGMTPVLVYPRNPAPSIPLHLETIHALPALLREHFSS
jgi:putative hydrolase of the HAD superfamily